MIANNEISALLSAEHWTWAKTMPGVPHEYIVRGRCRMTDAQFEAVWDAGCGAGRLLDLLAVPPERYHGCDSSQKVISRFREERPEYASHITARAFEECYHSWIHTDDAVIALHGSPNYIMLPYLKMLAASSRPLFLMFYHQGYKPSGLEAMHAYDYSVAELLGLFVGHKVREVGNYVLVYRS
jgi:hypothetical protein